MAISFLNDVSLPGTSTSLLMADGSNIPVGDTGSFLKVVDGEPVWSGGTPPAATPPSLRSSTSVSVNGFTQINIIIPTHVTGDFIIVLCAVSYSTRSFFNATTPTGWTRLNASNNPGVSPYYNSAIYYKTATSSSESNFTITASGNSSTYAWQTGTCAVFKDTAGISANTVFNSNTKVVSRTVPSIAAPAANSLEVALVTSSGGTTSTVYSQNFFGTGWSLVEKNARQANFYYNDAGIYQVAGGSPAAAQNDMTITTTNTSTGASFFCNIGYTTLRLGPE